MTRVLITGSGGYIGQVLMPIEGRIGRTFTVEVSHDFQTWTPVAAVQNLDGILKFVDPDAVDYQQRFYRVTFGQR